MTTSMNLLERSMTQTRSHPWGYWWTLFVTLLVLLVSSRLFFGHAGAAERGRPIRIGVLTESWGPQPQTVSLRDGLRKLGYREPEDFVIGVRFTQGDRAARPDAARALVQYGVDLIYVTRESAAQAAQRATTQIPIVFAGVGDPVGLGLVESFARPGGNTTGVTDLGLDLGPKRLELFREIVPGLKRVLFLYDATDTHAAAEARVYRDAARRLGIVLVEQAVRTAAEARITLARVRKGEVDGILGPQQVSLNVPGFILETATQQGIPTMFGGAFWVEQGVLAGYGPDQYETGRQTARLVDKILKGADPAEIPVEVNSKIEFVINLKTAKTLGLTIAPELLYRADWLIR
jgi:putative ABC transport system substrate-binding protein